MWPLHFWLPDAHTEAPTVGSVLLAGVLLKMGTYGLVRFARADRARRRATALAPYLGALAVVGIVYGALACLAQRDLKRLIAYSSVGHMGFVLLGIATLTPVGINGALFANVAHGLITGLLFFLVGAVKDRHDTADLDELGGGLYERLPRLGGAARVRRGREPRPARPGRVLGRDARAARRVRPGAGLHRGYYLVLMALGRRRRRAHRRRYFARAGPPGRPGRHERAGGGEAVLLRRRDAGASWSAWAPAGGRSSSSLGVWPALLLDVTDPSCVRLGS